MIGWTKVPLVVVKILFTLVLVLCIGESRGLSCYKCGQYNDGVGSITPCINSTAQMQLQECPSSSAWCIKYVSEGSTVRDCVPTCVEKGVAAVYTGVATIYIALTVIWKESRWINKESNQTWSTRTYCCHKEGCNRGGLGIHDGITTTLWMTVIAVIVQRLRG